MEPTEALTNCEAGASTVAEPEIGAAATRPNAETEMRVLITGASGFVGSALVRHLRSEASVHPVAALRHAGIARDTPAVVVGEIGPDTEWRAALEGIDAVVHCAGRAHQLEERARDPLGSFRLVNVEGTRRLAEQAAAAGVKRLIFISSVKVNGEAAPPERPFRETSPLCPSDPYAISKREAEDVLSQLARSTDLEVVVIRPPLVYGPNPKANMRRLLAWVASGLPLPFGSVQNRRSMVSLDNLVSGIAVALVHPAAAGKTYLISDQQDVSTPDLIGHIGAALGRTPNLWSVPIGLLRLAGKVSGRDNEIERLVGSLVVDGALITRDLGWRPTQTLGDGVAQMVAGFRE